MAGARRSARLPHSWGRGRYLSAILCHAVFIRDEATGEEVEYRKPVPGPGTYEAPSSLDRAARRQARGRADDAFLRSSERLPENTTIDGRKLTGDGAHPGPGEYDPSEKISGGHPVSSGTWKGGGRFSAHTTPTPGPALAHGTMITPTFNVTYGDRVDGDALGGTM